MRSHFRLITTIAIATLLLIPVVYVTAIKIHQHRNRNTLQALTTEMLDKSSRYSQAPKSDNKSELLKEAVAVADQRKQVMSQLIDSDPAAAVSQAMPESIRAQLPPEVRSRVEQSVSLAGYIGVVHLDNFKHEKSKTDAFLTTPQNNKVQLKFASPPGNLFVQAGLFSRAKGVRLDNKMAVPAGGLVTVGAG